MAQQAASYKTISKLIIFSGKKVEYPGWREKFIAKSNLEGFGKLYLEPDTYPIRNASFMNSPEYLELEDDEREEVDDIQDLNTKGYSELIMSISEKTQGGRIAFKLVKSTRNTEYPKGNYKLAMEALDNKFMPSNAPEYLKQSRISGA